MKIINKIIKQTINNLKFKINLDKQETKLKKLEDLFNYFGTDKGSKSLNSYSKLKNKKLFKGHNFAKFYEKHCKQFKKEKINILEIGVWEGASTASFYHYFKNAQFFSIDRNFKFKYSSKRINFFYCDTTSRKDLSELKNFFKKKKVSSFDIIIDDGSHILSNILKNLIFFFNYLKPGGIYVVEDYKHPNYYSYLNDVKNHPLIDKVLFFLKKKKIFKSKILSKKQIIFLINQIKYIFTHKGSCLEMKKNISDIAFLYKKNLNKSKKRKNIEVNKIDK
jgi:hypothetical protein